MKYHILMHFKFTSIRRIKKHIQLLLTSSTKKKTALKKINFKISKKIQNDLIISTISTPTITNTNITKNATL